MNYYEIFHRANLERIETWWRDDSLAFFSSCLRSSRPRANKMSCLNTKAHHRRWGDETRTRYTMKIVSFQFFLCCVIFNYNKEEFEALFHCKYVYLSSFAPSSMGFRNKVIELCVVLFFASDELIHALYFTETRRTHQQQQMTTWVSRNNTSLIQTIHLKLRHCCWYSTVSVTT